MKTLKNIKKLSCLFLLITSTFSSAQVLVNEQYNNPFKQLNEKYLKQKTHDTVYMDMVDSLASSMLDNGIYFTVSDMTQNLKQYEKLAWSKKEYKEFRNDYYVILLNNVFLSRQWGATIYYAEKLAKQNEKDGTPRPFVELGIKMYIYQVMHRNKKIIEIYEKEQHHFEELLKKAEKNPDDYYWESMDLLRIIEPAIDIYFKQNDTLKAEKAYQLANKLVVNINNAEQLPENKKVMADFYIHVFNFYRANSQNKYDKAQIHLNKIEKWAITAAAEQSEYTYSILNWKTQLFLDMKQVDSASFYINEMEKSVDFTLDQKIAIYKYKSQLELLKNNQQKSYEFLNVALDESIKVQRSIAEEMDNLLYAQTQAEHHKLAFEKSEQEKHQRNNLIILISALSLIAIIIVFIKLRNKDIKLKRVVEQLNETANVQIALMEQFGSKVRKEEQERLSQNLHDDLAGKLAAIKNNVDLAMLSVTKEEDIQWLTKLSNLAESAFLQVRDKSHELFEIANMPDEEMFRQHILNLAHIAFPSKHYTLNVQIDDYALKNSSIELRAQLIKVIQEAFTNIIKHAKATQVDLLIYEDLDKLFVIIKDNGKGFKREKFQNTLGLKNMQSRLKSFGADFTINGDNDGVHIIISIPQTELN